MMEERKKDKYLQTRYRRELERYLNKVVSFAMGDEFEKSTYENMLQKVLQKFNKIQKVSLYSDYFERLEAFVELTKELAQSDKDAEDIRTEILYRANQIRKSKRKKSYSRKSKKYGREDGY